MAEAKIKVSLEPDTRALDRALKGVKVGVPSGGEMAGGGGMAGGGMKAQTLVMTEMAGLTKLGLKGILGIGAILKGLDFVFKPLAAILTAVIALLFLPLLPVFKPGLEALAAFLPIMARLSQKTTEIIQKIFDGITDFITSFILTIGNFIAAIIQGIGNFLSPIVSAIIDLGKIIVGVIKGIFKGVANIAEFLLEEIIRPGFEFLLGIGVLLWEEIIKPGWEFLKNIGLMIWEETIKPGFNFLLNVGQMVWDIIKSGFEFVKTALKNAANGIIAFANSLIPGELFDVPLLGNGGIVTRPTLALIGERGPEAVIPLNQGVGGVTININNPIVKDERSMRQLADEISRIFAQQKLRGFSPSI